MCLNGNCGALQNLRQSQQQRLCDECYKLENHNYENVKVRKMNAKVNKVTAGIVMEVSERSISASYAPQFSVRDSLKDH